MNRTTSTLISNTNIGVPSVILQEPFVKERLGSKGVVRLYTLETFYPRIVHAEHIRSRRLTHSVASSRAIPTAKYIQNYTNFTPKTVRKNEKGMSPSNYLIPGLRVDVKRMWSRGIEFATHLAEEMVRMGVAKEQANRVLEPYSYVRDLITGTDNALDAFFKLRLDKNAQYEIRTVAYRMSKSMQEAEDVTTLRNLHTPYSDLNKVFWKESIITSVARSARTSYDSNATGKISEYAEDRDLFERLITPEIPHLSPSEHVVMSYVFFANTVLPEYLNYVAKSDTRFTVFETGCKVYKDSPNQLFKLLFEYRVEGNYDPGVIQLRRLIELAPRFAQFLLDK